MDRVVRRCGRRHPHSHLGGRPRCCDLLDAGRPPPWRTPIPDGVVGWIAHRPPRPARRRLLPVLPRRRRSPTPYSGTAASSTRSSGRSALHTALLPEDWNGQTTPGAFHVRMSPRSCSRRARTPQASEGPIGSMPAPYRQLSSSPKVRCAEPPGRAFTLHPPSTARPPRSTHARFSWHETGHLVGVTASRAAEALLRPQREREISARPQRRMATSTRCAENHEPHRGTSLSDCLRSSLGCTGQ